MSECLENFTNLPHSNDLNTFRSFAKKMSSSSDNELPEIPGTRFPWMDEGPSSSTSKRSLSATSDTDRNEKARSKQPSGR